MKINREKEKRKEKEALSSLGRIACRSDSRVCVCVCGGLPQSAFCTALLAGSTALQPRHDRIAHCCALRCETK